MKELNLNFLLLGLDGKEIKEANAGKLLSTVLAESTKGDALKLFHWAKELHSGNVLKLDPSDVKTLTEFISSSERLTNLSKAQILECL